MKSVSFSACQRLAVPAVSQRPSSQSSVGRMRRVRLMTPRRVFASRRRSLLAFVGRVFTRGRGGTAARSTNAILTIQLLGAKAVGPNNQHAITRKTAPSELRQPDTDARREAW